MVRRVTGNDLVGSTAECENIRLSAHCRCRLSVTEPFVQGPCRSVIDAAAFEVDDVEAIVRCHNHIVATDVGVDDALVV